MRQNHPLITETRDDARSLLAAEGCRVWFKGQSHLERVQVQQEKIIRENRFQGGRKSALNGCNSHFHMYAKTPIRPLRGP